MGGGGALACVDFATPLHTVYGSHFREGAISVVNFIIIFSVLALSVRDCEDDEYTCSDGECIRRDRRCDGLTDCQNKEDEYRCTPGNNSTNNWRQKSLE